MQLVQAEVIVIISASAPRPMQNAEMKRIVALGICLLFLAVPILGILSDTDKKNLELGEPNEQSFTNTSTSSINIKGSEAGLVFLNFFAAERLA